MNDNQLLIKRIVKSAIVMALYIALTFISYPIAFSGLQFRLSEMLLLLCFFNRDYILAITFGCFLTNLASPFMPWDLLIGTGATLISALGIAFCPFLGLSTIIPIAVNSFLIGYEYYFILEEPYWMSVAFVAIGETTIIVISYILCFIIFKQEKMLDLIDAKHHRDFKW